MSVAWKEQEKGRKSVISLSMYSSLLMLPQASVLCGASATEETEWRGLGACLGEPRVQDFQTQAIAVSTVGLGIKHHLSMLKAQILHAPVMSVSSCD